MSFVSVSFKIFQRILDTIVSSQPAKDLWHAVLCISQEIKTRLAIHINSTFDHQMQLWQLLLQVPDESKNRNTEANQLSLGLQVAISEFMRLLGLLLGMRQLSFTATLLPLGDDGRSGAAAFADGRPILDAQDATLYVKFD